MLEKEVEKYLTDEVKALGGLCLKFVSVNRRGVPDRIVIHPNIGTVFVELKRPGAEARKLQKYVHSLIEGAGGKVFIIDSREAADSFLERLRGTA